MTSQTNGWSGEPRDIVKREAEILGDGPRILPVDREEVADEVQAVTARLRGGVVGDAAPVPLELIPEIMFVMCRFPKLWDGIMDLALHVQAGPDGPSHRTRELAILRTSWLLGAPYEWGEHVRAGKRVGLTDEEIIAVREGSGHAIWSDHDRAVLRAAEQLRANAFIDDDTWAALKTELTDTQCVELIVLIGHLTNVAYFQNSIRLRLEANNAGLGAV